MTYLAQIVLSFCLIGAADADSAEILDLIAGKQAQTSKYYEGLSYRAHVTYTRYQPSLDKVVPFSTRYILQRRPNSYLLTIEYSHSFILEDQGESIAKTLGGPSVTRILKTPTYLAIWQDLAQPDIRLYFEEDHRDQTEHYLALYQPSLQRIDISRICFGGTPGFFELFSKKDASRWSVVDYNGKDNITIERMLPDVEQVYKKDLTIVLSPSGAQALSALFEPAGDPTVNITTSVEYVALETPEQEVLVPRDHVHKLNSSNKNSAFEQTMHFEDFSDTRNEPELRFQDLEPPAAVTIQRVNPNPGRYEPRRTWDGSEPNREKWEDQT